MENILKTIIYLLIFFIIYFIQTFIFGTFTIGGIKPNLYVIAIIIIGLYMKPPKAFAIGVVYGLIIDILNSKSIGITAIGLGLLGFGVANVEKMFSIESKLSLIIFIILGTVSYETLIYILKVIIYGTEISGGTILETILIEGLYNVLLTIIFYPLCKKILKIKTEEIPESNVESYLKRMR